MACTTQAYAQDSDEQASSGVIEQVIVTGTRQNLENAQEIKRNADTFVDVISAEDMGSLPDRSVLEAIQRLPGVSIERFAAADDPDHFSVEGSGAVIRGMTATRSEFNGRDSFSANSSRGLSFQDVPPELMAGVSIYKNQSADMIAGGIGGTVSLRTRKPFDQPERVMAVNVEGTWGDIAEEWTPTISALFSDRWETGAGEFGFLINASHSELVGTSHGIQSDVYKRYPASELAGAEEFVGSDGTGTVWLPQGSNLTMKEDSRLRRGLASSVQWQDNDGKYLLTAEYIRSKASLEWWENALKYQGGYTDDALNTRPYGDSEIEFNSQGLFQSGFLSHGYNEWPGNNIWRATSLIGPGGTEPNTRYPNPYSGMPTGARQFGHKFQADTRGSYTESLVEDMSLNFRWTPNDVWTVDLDYQHIEAESKNDDLTMGLSVAALQKYDITGSTPHLELIEPWGGMRDNNPEVYDNGVFRPGWTDDPQGDANYFQDETSYWWKYAMDHYNRSEGTSDAFRIDLNYAVHGSVITDVKGGIRWSEREQTVRNTSYGWGSVSPEWSDGTLYLDHVPEQSDWYSLVDWSDFHRGGVLDIPGNSLYHIDRDVVERHRDNRVCRGEGIQYSPAGDWVPYKCRAGVDSQYGIFLPNEISDTTETTNAAYVRVDFAFDDLPMRVAGNIGLRYFELERQAAGFVKSPSLDEEFGANRQLPAGLTAPLTGESVLAYAQAQVDANPAKYSDLDAFYNHDDNQWIRESFWYLSEEERAFATTGSGVLTATDDYKTWLPSLNVKVELKEDLIARFAASKAIALPDMGEVRNTISTGAVISSVTGDPENPETAADWESAIQSAEVVDWTGSGGNPYLQPMESIQYDASLEWYFADTGSLTGTVFYKDLSNFFVHGASRQPITNPATGQTALVDVVSTRNGGEGEMYGFEIAHQQFFDMLPAPWDGLGVQANYTWIQASGVPNNEESYENADWTDTANDTGARVSLSTVPLQGQSEHTANLVLMYEKYDWSARLAYNWRSKYLLTTRDVISKYPLWNDAAGFMDGSLFYHINDDFTVGIQATNLLDTQSETLMILDDQGTEAGRSWFIQDRRISFIARANF